MTESAMLGCQPFAIHISEMLVNSLRLAFFIFLLSQGKFALASECGQAISVDTVKKLPADITLGELEAKLGKWCQGHGPYSWYREKQGKKILFFWKRPNQPATTDAEGMKYHVLLAVEVLADDSDVQTIIWPLELIGKNTSDLLSKEYKGLHQE